MRLVVFIPLLLVLTPVLAESDYIITRIDNSSEFWIFPNKPILPIIRENFTSMDKICKVEERIRIESPRIATNEDIMKIPQDINGYLVYYDRILVGFHRCYDIKVNQTDQQTQISTQTSEQNGKTKILKTLIISFAIILIMFGLLFGISKITKRQTIPDYIQYG